MMFQIKKLLGSSFFRERIVFCSGEYLDGFLGMKGELVPGHGLGKARLKVIFNLFIEGALGNDVCMCLSSRASGMVGMGVGYGHCY